MRLEVKPLSVNEVWQGKRFKTDKYRAYERYLLSVIKPFPIPEGDLFIVLEFGFSNVNSDIDNPVKPFIDILQKKLGFNDKRISDLHLRKRKVKKGQEYIEYFIESKDYLNF